MANRAERIGAAALIVGFTAFAAVFATPALGDLGGDSAQYLALAEALASGRGYVDTHLPGTPLHGHYPPGLPLLLAPIAAAFGPAAFWPAKLVIVASVGVGLWLAYRWLARAGGPGSGVGAIAVCVASAPLLVQAVAIQSEGPFLACTFAALLALADRERHRSLWLAAACAAGAFLFRVAGVACVATVALVVLRRRSRRGLPLAAVCALPVLAFWLWTARAGGGTWSYGDELAAAVRGPAELAGHVAAGAWFYLQACGSLVAASPLVAGSPALAAAAAAVVATGFVIRVRRGGGPAELLFALTLAVAVLAPMRTVRYLVPVLPLLAFWFVTGVAASAGLARARFAPVAPRWAAAGLVILNLHATSGVVRARFEPRVVEAPATAASREPVRINEWEEGWFLGDGVCADRLARRYGDLLLLLAEIRRDLPEAVVLAARKPRLVSYLSGRPCVPLPAVTGGTALRRQLARDGVTHVVADGLYAATRSVVGATKGTVRYEPVLVVRTSACLALAPQAAR